VEVIVGVAAVAMVDGIADCAEEEDSVAEGSLAYRGGSSGRIHFKLCGTFLKYALTIVGGVREAGSRFIDPLEQFGSL